MFGATPTLYVNGRSFDRVLVVCAWGAAVLLGSGCASNRDAISAWQTGVTRYVEREGHGDLSVLRDLQDAQPQGALRPALHTVGVLDAGATRDVQSVFVGIKNVGDQNWYLFVAATLKRPSGDSSGIEDLRLVGVRDTGEKLEWRTGESDSSSIAKYSAGVSSTMRRAFPNPEDSFVLLDAADGAQVKEERSGAVFSLSLKDAPREPHRLAKGQNRDRP